MRLWIELWFFFLLPSSFSGLKEKLTCSRKGRSIRKWLYHEKKIMFVMATENVWVSKNDCVKWNVNILDFFVEFIFGFNYFCTWRQLFDILLLLILRLLLWVNCWSLLVFMMMLLRNSSSEILWIIGFFLDGWLSFFLSVGRIIDIVKGLK